MKKITLPKTEVKVSEENLKDITRLEIFKDRECNYYIVTSLDNESITLTNSEDSEDEYYLDFIVDELIFDEIGTPLNLEDFYSDIENVFENQKVEDEKTLKRCSN